MNALIDQNNNQTMIAALNTDGKTITRVLADPATGYLLTNDGTTGTNLAPAEALTDENGRKTLFALSATDGVTLVALNVDSTGALLVKSS